MGEVLVFSMSSASFSDGFHPRKNRWNQRWFQDSDGDAACYDKREPAGPPLAPQPAGRSGRRGRNGSKQVGAVDQPARHAPGFGIDIISPTPLS